MTPLRCHPGRIAGLCLLTVILAGCAGSRLPAGVPVPASSPGDCRDLRYRARYDGPAAERRIGLRIVVRVCGDGPLVFELRGRVGGTAVSGAAEDGRLRLIFPRDRLVVDGPDDPRVWSEWLGIPIAGEEWRRLLAGAESGELGAWRLLATGEEGHRAAEGPDGGRVDLWKLREAPSPAGASWPAAPEGFERVRVTAERPRGEAAGDPS